MVAALCSIDGCSSPSRSRGWCERHYKRWCDTGDPLTRSNRGHTVEERLKHRLTETPTGCWEFRGGHKPGTHQYGQLKVNGRMVTTHRLAYQLWVGPIRPGGFVCHTCDNPPCCNPAHLFVGTQTDNMMDMTAKGRGNISGILERPPDMSERIRAGWRRRHLAAARAAGVPDDWKRCSKCVTWKDRIGFARSRKESDGLQVYCRACMSLTRKLRRETCGA